MTPRPPAAAPLTPPAPAVQDPIYYQPGTDGAGQLREFVDIILRGKRLILATLLAVAVPVAVWTFLQPSLYEASTLLLIDKPFGSRIVSGSPLPGTCP